MADSASLCVNGLHFALPPEWAPARITGGSRRGILHADDGKSVRLTCWWTTAFGGRGASQRQWRKWLGRAIRVRGFNATKAEAQPGEVYHAKTWRPALWMPRIPDDRMALIMPHDTAAMPVAQQVAAGLARSVSCCTDIYDTHFRVPEGFMQTGCRLNPGCQSFTFTRGGERLGVWSLSMPDRVLAVQTFEEWSKAFIEREWPRRYVFERMAGSLEDGQCSLIGRRRARWFLWPNEWTRPSKAAVYGRRDPHRLYLALYEGPLPDTNDSRFDLRMGHGDDGGQRAG